MLFFSYDWSDFVYSTHALWICVYSYSLQNNTNISRFSFVLPAPDMKKNYAFRIRMRLECTQKTWGEWSPVKYWRNDTGTNVSMFWQLCLLILYRCVIHITLYYMLCLCFFYPPFLQGPCITEASSFTVKHYLLISMAPVAGFMLVYAITHDRYSMSYWLFQNSYTD